MFFRCGNTNMIKILPYNYYNDYKQIYLNNKNYAILINTNVILLNNI